MKATGNKANLTYVPLWGQTEMMLEHASPRGRGPCSEGTEPPKTEATKVKGARKIIWKRDYQQVGTQQAQGLPGLIQDKWILEVL